MWCLWQSLPCSIQCLSLATTLCFAESDLVAFALPLGMACVWTWLWQATLPLCRDCLLRRRCGRQAGQCDTPLAFVCRGAQLPVAADACSAGVRCVGDYDSRPSVCHADTSGSVPAAPLQSRESIVGDGAYCRGLSRRFLRLPVVSRSQFVRSCLIFDIAVCQPQTQSFHFCVGGA